MPTGEGGSGAFPLTPSRESYSRRRLAIVDLSDTMTTQYTNAEAVQTWRTVAEAAALLGVSTRTLERRLADGRYQVEHVGGRRLIDCGRDATAEAQLLADSRAMGAEARSAAGMLTVMLQQSLTERTAEVTTARGEALEARRASHRAYWVIAASVSVSVGLAFAAVTYRASDAHMADTVADLTVRLAEAEAENATLARKVESAQLERLAQLSDARWSWGWILGRAQ